MKPQANTETCTCKELQPPTHFIGIGGAGMSAIAQVLHYAGCVVQGSDIGASAASEMLKSMGVPVFIGHQASNIAPVERVVYTRAVPAENVELKAAREQGIRTIERAEMLGELYRLFARRVSVTGTHGKTSSSAMLAHILARSGMDPTALIGGDVPSLGGHARFGKSDLIVAEACEAYESFLHLRSSAALITNVDTDHLDHYETFDHIKKAFREFIALMDPDAVILACADDPELAEVCQSTGRSYVTYGYADEAAYRITKRRASGMDQTVHVAAPDLDVSFNLKLPGKHYASNAAGAIVMAHLLGCSADKLAVSLDDFVGVKRRSELKGEAKGVRVMDDYAHHPTEIRATLEALRSQFKGKLTVVFQPHQYSRTKQLLEQFAQSLKGSHRLVLTDVYEARADSVQGVNTERLYNRLLEIGAADIHYIPLVEDVAEWLESRVRKGELVITMGAGDVFRAGEDLLMRLANP